MTDRETLLKSLDDLPTVKEQYPSGGHPGNERVARMMLRAVYQMSDHAEKLGGATTIAGIAALHALQKSLQSNRARAAEYLDTTFD